MNPGAYTHPTSRAPQHRPKVLVEVVRRVLVVDLHLEHAQADDPRDEPRQRGLACPAHPYQEQVALRLAEDAVDAQDVLQDLVEQNEGDV